MNSFLCENFLVILKARCHFLYGDVSSIFYMNNSTYNSWLIVPGSSPAAVLFFLFNILQKYTSNTLKMTTTKKHKNKKSQSKISLSIIICIIKYKQKKRSPSSIVHSKISSKRRQREEEKKKSMESRKLIFIKKRL